MEIDNIIELLKNNKEKKIILTHFRDSTKEIAQSMSLDNVYIVDDGYKFVLEV